MGYSLQNLPSGAPSERPKPIQKTPEVSDRAEREAMRDEVQAYLQYQVTTLKLSIERATTICAVISQDVLQAPDWRFKRYANKSVRAVVEDFL